MSRIAEIPGLYRKHFADPRKERVFLSSLSFFLSFATCRIVTHAIRAQRGPFRNIVAPGGTHIHHSTFGILGLMGVGYIWLLRWGIGHPISRSGMRETALLYGAGSALTLDEFALWLRLEDDYWNKEGRLSIDAVILFGALLSMTAGGASFLKELFGIGTRR